MRATRIMCFGFLLTVATHPLSSGGDSVAESTLAKGISAYVAKFERSDPNLVSAVARFKQKQAQAKRKRPGWKPPWEGYKRAKSRSDYEKLGTMALATQCFSTNLWAKETLIYHEPRYGVARAGIYHDGFSVLYERSDFWDGIAAVYRHLSQRLGKAKRETERMDLLFNLQAMQHAYTYPLFRGRLKGHEKALLSANLVSLKAVLSYTREAKQQQEGPFWGAGVAYGLSCPVSALLKRVDPEGYSGLLGRLQSAELSFTKPDPAQVETYIELFIAGVEEALASDKAESQDTMRKKAEQGAAADGWGAAAEP